jgi:hypothetical protein
MHPYSSPVSDFNELRAPAQRRKPAPKPRVLAKIELHLRVLTSTEQAQLIAALGKCRNPLVLAGTLLMVETLLRVNSLIHNILWGDVSWECQTLRLDVHGVKHNRPWNIPLSTAAIQMLQDLGPGKPTEPILNISYPAFKKAFARACHRSGVKGVTVNNLRQMPARRVPTLGVMIPMVPQSVPGT